MAPFLGVSGHYYIQNSVSKAADPSSQQAVQSQNDALLTVSQDMQKSDADFFKWLDTLERHQSVNSTPLNHRSALRLIHTGTVAPPQALVQASIIWFHEKFSDHTSAHTSAHTSHDHIPSLSTALLQATQNLPHDSVIPNMDALRRNPSI